MRGITSGRRAGWAITGSAAAGLGVGRRRAARWFTAAFIAATAALAVCGLGSSAARAASTNLLPNGGFEGSGGGSLSGFKGQGATLSLASDGVGGGHAAKVTDLNASTSYDVYTAPRPVTSTSKGAQYSAGGEERSASPGKTVCLVVQELSSSGAVVGSGQKCRTTTSAWAALPTVTYTAAQAGSSLNFEVRQTGATSGNSFEVDNLTLTGTLTADPLVALWHMNETSGTTMYDSVGHNNGTLHSVTVGLPGFSGTAYGFNGSVSKGYVSVPSATALNPGTSNFAFTIHVKLSVLPKSGDYDVMRKGIFTQGSPSQEYKMEIQQSGQASCGFRGSAANAQLIAGPSVVNGQWHTLECSKTATSIVLTVDGHSYTHSVKIGSISNTSPLVMGAHPGFDYYNGLLDEASVSKG